MTAGHRAVAIGLGSAVLALAAATAGPGAARAQDLIVRVEGHQVPWSTDVNPDLAFGRGDGQPPRYVVSPLIHPGALIRLYAKGSVTVLKDDLPHVDAPTSGGFHGADEASGVEATAAGSNPIAATSRIFAPSRIGAAPTCATGSVGTVHPTNGSWGPEGQPAMIADGRTGICGTRYPSYYIAARHYPVRVNELVGAFVDADGTVVGTPFPVGRFVALRVPDGAAAIALGLNSEMFSINRGEYLVLVTGVTPRVIVEPSPDQQRPPPALPAPPPASGH